MNLSELTRGEEAYITGFSDSDISLKLNELGCLVGEKVKIVRKAIFGDPIAIEINGGLLSMRKDVARQINIDRVKPVVRLQQTDPQYNLAS